MVARTHLRQTRLRLSRRPPDTNPRSGRAAEQRYELAPPIKKTRSHGTIATRVDLAKRRRLGKGLPFSSSRVGRRPVGNSFDHLVSAADKRQWNREAERLGGLEIDYQLDFGGLLHRKIGWFFALEDAARIHAGETV